MPWALALCNADPDIIPAMLIRGNVMAALLGQPLALK